MTSSSLPPAANSAFAWLQNAAQKPCQTSTDAALAHQNQLTKPPGSLGRLEQVAVQLAGLQATVQPHAERVHVSIFAGDHGVASEGVSAFPQAVTGQMIRNFAHGGAAIAVLCRQLNAQLRVANLGTVAPVEAIAGVDDNTIAPGTANFTKAPAMDDAQLAQALAVGARHLDELVAAGGDLFIGGEMGIANTTAASALSAALLGIAPAALVGPGTGISSSAQQHKLAVIERALALHQLSPGDPLRALRCVGGFEIAALCGAYIRAAQLGVAVLVDGFITTSAALTAVAINPAVRPWLILGHASTEPGHRLLIEALGLEPLVQLDLRLGEASGAACAVPLLRLACALHHQMATFASAGVSSGA